MGICDFYVEIKGKTPEEAFASAVAQAKETHGDHSHTGSIVEKTEFILIEDSVADVDELLRARYDQLARERCSVRADEPVWHYLTDEKQFIQRERRLFLSRPKKRGRDKARAIAYALIAAHDDRVNAPSKPAGIIRCTVGNYLLFGLTHE